jgi:hypothetical protein
MRSARLTIPFVAGDKARVSEDFFLGKGSHGDDIDASHRDHSIEWALGHHKSGN